MLPWLLTCYLTSANRRTHVLGFNKSSESNKFIFMDFRNTMIECFVKNGHIYDKTKTERGHTQCVGYSQAC